MESPPSTSPDSDAEGSTWPLPKEPRKQDGAPRRIGVELEVGYLEPKQCAEVIRKALGGRVEVVSPAEYRVIETRIGQIRTEKDWRKLKQLAKEEAPNKAEFESIQGEVLGALAQQFSPTEIVTDPIEMRQLAIVDELVACLRDAGAEGTRAKAWYAFGVHLNPELPNTDARTITRFLKAYTCLAEWLREDGETDLARRLGPYIRRYPAEYVRLVVTPRYWPAQEQLIRDYLAHNATRNRALDLLPLFCELDPDAVRAAVDDPLIKARPTLHYRLPNSQVDEPDWSLRQLWERWLRVEALASDEPTLQTVCSAYCEHLDATLIGQDKSGWLATLNALWDELIREGACVPA